MSVKSHFVSILRHARLGTASVLCLWLLASTAFAGRRSTAINVTTSIYDFDTAGSALLTQSDDYPASPCAGVIPCATYATTGTCPGTCLGSVIDPSNGRWVLSLYDQSIRKIRLTPSLISGTFVNFLGSYSATVEVYAQCWTNGVETGLLGVTLGNPNNNCAFGVDFSTTGGTKFKLEMGQPPLVSGAPATGFATVTCNTTSGSTCNSWTIVPTPSITNAMVANLYQYTKRGIIFVGQYENTYRIKVTNP